MNDQQPLNSQQKDTDTADRQERIVKHLGALARIGELLRTQDNRITDRPIFIVQQLQRDWGYDSEYAEDFCWCDTENDYIEADPSAAAELEILDSANEDTAPWQRIYYRDRWEFVTACFTEQGCKDYLEKNGHNLKEARIYADGSFRNDEFRAIRDVLMCV